MKKIILFLLVVLGFSTYGQQSIYTDNDGDGVIEYTLQDKSGNVLETGYYYNGKMYGTWTSFFPNGKKQMVAKFKDGKRNGTWFIYDLQGRITFQIVYKDGLKVSASENRYN
jgi:antitoxin component YwqK of YwqJK toxin-antitoxin module